MPDNVTQPAQPAPSYDDLHMAAAAKAKAASAEPAKAEPASPAPAQPGSNPEPLKAPIADKVDPETFKKLTALTKANREFQDKVKVLEGQSKEAEQSVNDAKLFREVKALYKAGKKMEAIAKLAEGDATQEMQALLADYLGESTQTSPDQSKPATPSPLEEKVAELSKRLDDQATKEKAQADAAMAEQARIYSSQLLDELKVDGTDQPKFPLSSRADNRALAYDMALEAAAVLAEARGLSPDEQIPPETCRELMVEAFAEVEEEFRQYGKRFSTETQSSPEQTGSKPLISGTVTKPQAFPSPDSSSRRVPVIDRSLKAPITVSTEAPNPGHSSHDAALARIKAQFRK